MNKKQKYARLNITLPPDLAECGSEFAEAVAKKAGYGAKASISGIIQQALYEMKANVQGKINALQEESDGHNGNPVNSLKNKKKKMQ